MLALHGTRERIALTTDKNKRLQIEVITLLPLTSLNVAAIPIPPEMPGRVFPLHEFLALFDEIRDFHELDRFYEFLALYEPYMPIPFVTILDKYGSFRDFEGVIVPGAREYNLIAIDPHWGTDKRYRTLSEFWSLFPLLDKDYLGHPRNWLTERVAGKRVSLVARNHIGRILVCKVGKTTILIQTPLHKLQFEQAHRADLLTEIVEDCITLNENVLAQHHFFQTEASLWIAIFPASLVRSEKELTHLRHLLQKDAIWTMDSGVLKAGGVGLQIVFNEDLLVEYLINAIDRTLEFNILVKLIEQLDQFVCSNNLVDIVQQLHAYKVKEPRFRMKPMEMVASFPELVSPSKPSEFHHRAAGREIALIAQSMALSPGEYVGESAKEFLNTLRSAVVTHIDQNASEYRYEAAIPFLIEKIDALIHEHVRTSQSLEASLEHEVEYDRAVRGGESKTEFLSTYKAYCYLIEKFVQIKPEGAKDLEEPEFQSLIALVQKLLLLYDASDTVNYQAYPVRVTVNDDFVVDVDYLVDIDNMLATFQTELSEISLGLRGTPTDRVESPTSVEEFLDAVDKGFELGLGLGFKNLINTLDIMSKWAVIQEEEFRPYYCSTPAEITEICERAIEGFDARQMEAILDFLTLKSEQMLLIQGQTDPTEDLPVWEYYKRPGRYNIRPLIKLNNLLYWGAHSARRAAMVWVYAVQSGKLPYDIQNPEIQALIDDEKAKIERALEEKTSSILREFTEFVETRVQLHRRDRDGGHPAQLGDYDVLAYFAESNLILNVECKDILPAFCRKDDSRIRRKFFGTGEGDNKGYLERVERRADYLIRNTSAVMHSLGWSSLAGESCPRIVSLFVSRRPYWWTRFPPVKTDIKFMTVDMLRDFVREQVN
jgi:hypothetical protein